MTQEEKTLQNFLVLTPENQSQLQMQHGLRPEDSFHLMLLIKDPCWDQTMILRHLRLVLQLDEVFLLPSSRYNPRLGTEMVGDSRNFPRSLLKRLKMHCQFYYEIISIWRRIIGSNQKQCLPSLKAESTSSGIGRQSAGRLFPVPTWYSVRIL